MLHLHVEPWQAFAVCWRQLHSLHPEQLADSDLALHTQLPSEPGSQEMAFKTCRWDLKPGRRMPHDSPLPLDSRTQYGLFFVHERIWAGITFLL